MNRQPYLVLILLVVIVLMAGCGGEDDPVSVDPNRNCTIVISPVPESLKATWSLTGPDDFSRSGTGAQTLNVYPGAYTIVWDPMDGFNTPEIESLTLPADVRVIFYGIYGAIKDPTGIWVDFIQVRPGLAPNYNIEIANTIPDFDVLLYVNLVFVDTVKADTGLKIILGEGVQHLAFIPLNGWYTFEAHQNIQSDMFVKISYSYIDPPPE